MKPAALVLLQDPHTDEVLLVKRRDVPVWVLPGGGIDPGEEAIEAARRELLEETALVCGKLKLRGHFIPVNSLTQETSIFYTSEFSGLPLATEETAEVAFFKLDMLPNSLFPLHRAWIFRLLGSDQLQRGEIREVTWRTFLAYALCHPWIVLRFAWTVFTKP